MIRHHIGFIFIVSSLFFCSAAIATPALQLDIVSDNTFYDTADETITTSSDLFTLYAYGNTANGNGAEADFTQEHYISFAISPRGTTAGTDFGSFSVNGTSYNTADMSYGVPPFESNILFDGGDLARHDIFDTLFTEIAFNFDIAQTRSDSNTENTPGTNPLLNSGNEMAYVGFDVDTSDLLSGFELHFDLYNTRIRGGGDIDRDDFAPFSHDAATVASSGTVPPFPLPAPNAMALLGLGLLGLVISRRKMKV